MSRWSEGVIYQVYPRSFADSDGDGVGDLAGIEGRLDHIAGLGASALWLSPIYPSPLADFGYDVSDHRAVDPEYGTLDSLDRLVAAAHDRGLRLLLDLVPCHTSIEHPWFAEHPEWYIWAEGRGDGPPNNWLAAFGGSAWTRDPASGRWYLHSFYPEQPDLDWRNPEVVRAMQDVMRFWLDRGVDGFRVDAIDRLLKDPELRDDPPATRPFPLPLHAGLEALDRVHSANSPDIPKALGALREAAGDALLVGEVYLPAVETASYLKQLDAVFAFEFLHAPWEAERLRAAVEVTAALERDDGEPGAAWVLSNHDFPRLSTRVGPQNARAAAVLLLTLPGLAFVYQGDEIGQIDGPGADPPLDRAGRDAHRHPVQWTSDPSTAGFTTGRPWLAPVDPLQRSVAAQAGDAASLLELYRDLIALRPRLQGAVAMLESAPGVVAFKRGAHAVAVNTGAEPVAMPVTGPAVVRSRPGALTGETLAPYAAVVVLCV